MRFGILVFPGSNCDHDCYHVLKHVLDQPTEFLWHKQTDLSGIDVIIIPGGFSYGDYLRTGAIAQYSPIMKSVRGFADSGGLVLGICNGFQILLEAGLLPGAMLRNQSLKFICKDVFLRIEHSDSPFTSKLTTDQVIRLPVAHADGNYYADPETLRSLEENGQVIFRYCEPDGRITKESNPNGSIDSIAGISNRDGNVMGLMPHPDRSSDPVLGNTDGKAIFESLLHHKVQGIR